MMMKRWRWTSTHLPVWKSSKEVTTKARQLRTLKFQQPNSLSCYKKGELQFSCVISQCRVAIGGLTFIELNTATFHLMRRCKKQNRGSWCHSTKYSHLCSCYTKCTSMKISAESKSNQQVLMLLKSDFRRSHWRGPRYLLGKMVKTILTMVTEMTTDMHLQSNSCNCKLIPSDNTTDIALRQTGSMVDNSKDRGGGCICVLSSSPHQSSTIAPSHLWTWSCG